MQNNVAYNSLFGCVIAFSVNSPNDLVSAAHLVFTGLAILSGYVALMTLILKLLLIIF
jgi:hypothetical protein